MLKICVHPDFGTQFLHGNVLNEFRSCRSPNWAYDSFLKIPRCLVYFLKFQLMFRCGFAGIGLEVKSVQRESDSKQQTLGLFFQGFQL